MTPLEDKLRRAFQSRAEQVPPGFAPPLRLPPRSRRSFPLVHGGGQRRGAPVHRSWLAPAASAVLVVTVIAASVAISRVVPGHRQGMAAAASSGATSGSRRNSAAAWITTQVSQSDVVACDQAMCQALRAQGFPGRQLVAASRAGLSAAQVVVATSTVRQQRGAALSADAPGIIASFGTDAGRVEVRMTYPGGAAAYRSALRQDEAERQSAGAELASSGKVAASAAVRRQLRAGQVDAQVLIVLTSMAAMSAVSVVSFGDSGPGAGAGIPLRSAEVTTAGTMPARKSTSVLRQMLAFLEQQKAPYRPAQAGLARLPDGRPAIRLSFAAPSPLGLLADSTSS